MVIVDRETSSLFVYMKIRCRTRVLSCENTQKDFVKSIELFFIWSAITDKLSVYLKFNNHNFFMGRWLFY